MVTFARLFAVNPLRMPADSNSTFADQDNYSYMMVADQPVVLYINRESREEGLRFYKRAFHHSLMAQNGVYFNREIDTVYISCNASRAQLQYFGQQNAECLKTVEKLALPIVEFGNTFAAWNEVFKPSEVSVPIPR